MRASQGIIYNTASSLTRLRLEDIVGCFPALSVFGLLGAKLTTKPVKPYISLQVLPIARYNFCLNFYLLSPQLSFGCIFRIVFTKITTDILLVFPFMTLFPSVLLQLHNEGVHLKTLEWISLKFPPVLKLTLWRMHWRERRKSEHASQEYLLLDPGA